MTAPVKWLTSNQGKASEACSASLTRISSPYTKIKHTKYDIAPIVLIIAILLFISLVVYLILRVVKVEPKISRELLGKERVVYYECTK